MIGLGVGRPIFLATGVTDRPASTSTTVRLFPSWSAVYAVRPSGLSATCAGVLPVRTAGPSVASAAEGRRN